MAIKITDNFQVNIKNPIDNRFVVGSQSIPGGPGSIYPTPFYAYRDDISSNIGFVYPGLRIWDFNDNLPYVWTGTTWSNENLTGASVLNSGDPAFSAGGGYRNYITKFYDTSTVLTKSLLFDNNIHVSLNVTGIVNPNSSGGLGDQPLISSSIPNGLHVQGRIRTNTGFVGSGRYVHQINSQNIDGGLNGTGRLQLNWIATNSPNGSVLNPGTFVLTSKYLNPTDTNPTTSWQNILNVAPFWEPSNLPINTTLPNSSGAFLYSGQNTGANYYEFFSLVSSGLQIDSAVSGSVRIESKQGIILPGGSASVYKGLDSTTKLHEFRSLKSNNLIISETSNLVNIDANIMSDSLNVTPDGIGIRIEVPVSFEGAEIYVNGLYNGAEQLGTRSKPYKTLKAAINKILNRSSNDPLSTHRITYTNGGFTSNGIGPTDTFNSNINGGNAYNKWEPRSNGVRVIIQSYCRVTENLAINNVTYFLESETNSYLAVEQTDFNLEWTGSEDPRLLEWVIDMKELSDTAQRNMTYGTSTYGSLTYGLSCGLEGSGRVYFSGAHLRRKGFFRSYATNGYDYIGKLPTGDSTGNKGPQNGSQLIIGSIGGKLALEMYSLPTLPGFSTTSGLAGSHISGTISLFGPKYPPPAAPSPIPNDADTYHLNRENTEMYGYRVGLEPDYGCIQVEGRNFPYSESLFLKGEIVINACEQHMMYFKDYGTGYSEDCRIYMRRNYQNVLVDNNGTFKYVRLEEGRSNIGDFNRGDYLIITTLGSFNWSLVAVANTFRNLAGIQSNATPGVGWAFKWNGTVVSLGTAKVARCQKQYLPCKLVYDFYFKRGGRFNHGGDFYTQQNTGANQGGPDSFACLTNDIANAGSISSNFWYPQADGNSSTFCQFRATGGGFVTSLIYNHFIKTVTESTYGIYRQHDILLRNLKIDSYAYTSVLRAQSTTGADWVNTHGFGRFFNCLFADYNAPYSVVRTLFSNQPVYANVGSEVGKMILSGTRIDLSNAVLDTIIKTFANPGDAVASGLSSGCLYKTNDVIKIIP